MADEKQFEIKIKTTSEGTGAQDAARDLDKLAGTTEESAKQTERHGEHSKELNKAFRKLNEITPGLGEALKGAFNPQLLGIIAISVLVEKLVEHFRDVQAAAKEAATAAAEVWQVRRDAAEELVKLLGEAQGKQGEILKGFEGEKTILAELIEQRKKLLGTPDSLGEAAQLQLSRDQLTRTRSRQPGLEDAALQAQFDLENAGKKLPSLAGRDEKALKIAAEAVTPEILRNAQNAVTQLTAEHGANSPEAARARENLARVRQPIEDFQQFEADRRQIAAYHDLEEKLKRAIEAREANTAAINEQTEKIRTATAVLGIHQQTERFAALGDGSTAAAGLQHGYARTPAEAEQVKTFIDLAQSVGATNPQIIQIIKMIISGQVSMADELAALKQNYRNFNRGQGN